MNYSENYHTRISAKTHKTKQYSEAELSAIRKQIKRFLNDKDPSAILNSNEANYIALSNAINEFYKEEVLAARFIYDIYLQNSDNKKKNIRKMNAIVDFIKHYYQQQAPQMQKTTMGETERLFQKMAEMQQDMQTLMGWMQQLVHQGRFVSDDDSQFAGGWSQPMLIHQRA